MYQTSMAKCVTESVSEMRTENQEAFSELFSRNSSIPMASSSVDLQCLGVISETPKSSDIMILYASAQKRI